jgi:hypothetical protein
VERGEGTISAIDAGGVEALAVGQFSGLFACEECGGEEPFGFLGRAGVGGLSEFDDEWAH